MKTTEKIRSIVSRLCRVEPDQLRPEYPLAALLSSSIQVHLLESAIKQHLGFVLPRVHTFKSYAELEAAIMGASSAVATSAATPNGIAAPPFSDANSATTSNRTMLQTQPQSGSKVSCGFDMETVANLPAAEDFWVHEFYTDTFTRPEIAYCVRQAEPRRHFAARWCAKEALKKCDPAFLEMKMRDIQVHHDEAGAPLLQKAPSNEIIPYALSLSHTDEMAAALVIRLPSEPERPLANETSATEEISANRSYSTEATLALVLGIVATILSAVALVRTFSP